MEIKRGRALLAYERDIRQRGIWDWIKAHTSFVKPLHRYDGEIILEEDRLIFEGRDSKQRTRHHLEIDRNDITDVRLGFDDQFRRMEDRSLGIGFQPLRIHFTQEGQERTVYLIVDFRRLLRTSGNKDWLEELTRWAAPGVHA